MARYLVFFVVVKAGFIKFTIEVTVELIIVVVTITKKALLAWSEV